MNKEILMKQSKLLEYLLLDEEPMGMHFTDDGPIDGFSPLLTPLPTREDEINNSVDWQVMSKFSCVLGHLWKARKKKKAAYFSAEKYGCLGAAYWLGYNKPQLESIIRYVSTGNQGNNDGELYCDSPDNLRRVMEYIDPVPASGKYCVFKPISHFQDSELPEFVTFSARPEVISGIYSLTMFVTNDPEVVTSPWGAACTSLVSWPVRYASQGLNKAVLGGWDPSARKYFKTDELSFTVPYSMFLDMLNRQEESFLTTSTWKTVSKKIKRSRKVWNEITL